MIEQNDLYRADREIGDVTVLRGDIRQEPDDVTANREQVAKRGFGFRTWRT